MNALINSGLDFNIDVTVKCLFIIIYTLGLWSFVELSILVERVLV